MPSVSVSIRRALVLSYEPQLKHDISINWLQLKEWQLVVSIDGKEEKVPRKVF